MGWLHILEPLSQAGASVVIIAVSLVVARFLRHREPLVSASQPAKALVFGIALGGPFVLERADALRAAGGWDIVAALALSMGLFLLAVRVLGPGDGNTSASGSG